VLARRRAAKWWGRDRDYQRRCRTSGSHYSDSRGALDDDFFNLRTGIAGEILQKFAVYGSRIAIVGDTADRAAASNAFAAFVAEANRGRDVWFVRDLEEIAKRLSGTLRDIEFSSGKFAVAKFSYSTFFQVLSEALICFASSSVFGPRSFSYAVPSCSTKKVITPEE
jgi:hypothetical protein